MKTLIKFIISLFYIGKTTYAPGTVASFLIMMLWFFIPNNVFIQTAIIFIVAILGTGLCYVHTRNISNKDPNYIVIDEAVGMMISLFLLPKVALLYLLSFLLFRFFDIVKPSIIDRSQQLRYGVGIMLDDALSGLIVLFLIGGYIS